MRLNYLVTALFCLIPPLICPMEARLITLSENMPIEGTQVIITLDQPAEKIVVQYRPNTELCISDTLRADSATTTFVWHPARAGVTQLSVVDSVSGKTLASCSVSVQFNGLSIAGLTVMIIAGLILFGGVGLSFALLFRQKSA